MFDVDKKKANFSIGWKLCARFQTQFWGPTELRWPWPGGGLGPISGSPQIGDYISYRRSIIGVRMNGMSPSLVFGVIRKNHHGGESVPDGAPFLGAPDGAGPFEQTAFSYTYNAGKGDDFTEGWIGSYTGSIGFGAFVGPDLKVTPLLRHVDPDDITALDKYIKGSGGYQDRLDFNEDGQLTQADVTALTTLMNQAGFRSILLGDVNGDWVIDVDDLTAMSGQTEKEWGNASFYPQADVDQSSTVTTEDYDLLEAYLK